MATGATFVNTTIPLPETYQKPDPSVNRRMELDAQGCPMEILPYTYSFSGRHLVSTYDYNAGTTAQTLDARALFAGDVIVQNVSGAANITLPTLANYKLAAGQRVPVMTAVQRTAVTVGGSNYPGSEEWYSEFQIRNVTASAITLVVNGDNLITFGAATGAARQAVAATTVGTFRIYCNNVAGTGAAYFCDRIA
jgi:hypothetical protein